MTLDHAFEINQALAELEFPLVFSRSILFALFKTYGIPSMSKLLVATGELANEKTTSKRAADTGVLLTEIIVNPPDSKRAIDGIARMNFLHDRYRQTGKISDKDVLYTLSLFLLEPIRWTKRLEWRDLTDIERCALATYWKAMGDAMEISYTLLKSSTWQDGLQWMEELEEWSAAYETENMKPALSSKRLAEATFDVALYPLPTWARRQGRNFAATLLEPRLRKAMMTDDPPTLHQNLASFLLTIRKLVVRHLLLLRPWILRVRWNVERPDPQTGRYHTLHWLCHPWYIKPIMGSRWNLRAWYCWVVGRVIPGDEGDNYCPEGYHIKQIGPEALRDKGAAEMRVRLSTLQRDRGVVVLLHLLRPRMVLYHEHTPDDEAVGSVLQVSAYYQGFLQVHSMSQVIFRVKAEWGVSW